MMYAADIEHEDDMYFDIFNRILSTFQIFPTTTPVPPLSTREIVCQNAGGTWIEKYSECEGMNQQQCTTISGVFDSCASDCRHEISNKPCNKMCVPVCTVR